MEINSDDAIILDTPPMRVKIFLIMAWLFRLRLPRLPAAGRGLDVLAEPLQIGDQAR
jgi:hypothetical protein